MKKKKKYRAVVIGSMVNKEKRQWADTTKAYESVKSVVSEMGTSDEYYEDLAYELRIAPEELPEYLQKNDSIKEMEALIKVLKFRPGVAIKPFSTYREAQSFIALLEQMDYEEPNGEMPVNITHRKYTNEKFAFHYKS